MQSGSTSNDLVTETQLSTKQGSTLSSLENKLNSQTSTNSQNEFQQTKVIHKYIINTMQSIQQEEEDEDFYIVQDGNETLASIALKHKIDLRELMAMNTMSFMDMMDIYKGQVKPFFNHLIFRN